MAFNIPNEGEIFSGGDEQTYFRRVGDSAQSFDIIKAFIPESEMQTKYKGWTYGQLASEARNKAKEAGYDLSNIKSYNIGDLLSSGAFKTQQGASGNYFAGQYGGSYQDFFSPLYKQQQKFNSQPTADFPNPGYSQIQTVDGRIVNTGGTGGVYAPTSASQDAQRAQINQALIQGGSVQQPANTLAQPGPMGAQTFAPLQAPQVAGAQGTPVAYSGNSIVDYLKTAGMPTDVQSRGVLATQYGLVKSPEEYVRLAAAGANGDINNKLLQKLRADGGSTKIETQDIGDGTPQTTDQTYTDTIQANEESFNSLVSKYLAEYGITDVRGFGNNPMMTFEDIYSKAMKNAGLDEAKSLIETISAEIRDENNKMAEEIQKIDGNPWISEGLRSKKISQTREKYENRVQGMNQRLALIQSAYDRSVENVRYGVEQTMKGVYAQYDFQRDLLNRAMDRAEKEIEAQRKAKEFDPQIYLEIDGGLYDTKAKMWVIQPKEDTLSLSKAPSSYQEWQLAGGEKGTGMTYAQYLSSGGGGGGTQQGDYAQETALRSSQIIQDIKSKVSGWNVGLGSLISKIPGTESRDFKAMVDSLKANIGFNELNAMRQASKTGGALGQVSDREIALLTSVLGSLDTGQSKDAFLASLAQIEASIQRWQQAAGQSAPGGYGPVKPAGNIVTAPDGNQYQIVD